VPEHSGAEILSDLDGFWTWSQRRDGRLASYLCSQNVGIELDFDHVLASGESADGYMTLMFGLT